MRKKNILLKNATKLRSQKSNLVFVNSYYNGISGYWLKNSENIPLIELSEPPKTKKFDITRGEDKKYY